MVCIDRMHSSVQLHECKHQEDAVGDGTRRRQYRHLANSTKHTRRFWFCPFALLCENMTSAIKLKVYNHVLDIVGQKCALTASHAAPWWVMVSMPMTQTDGRTDGRTPDRYVTSLSTRRGQRNIVSHCRQTTTEPQPQVTCADNSVKFGLWFLKYASEKTNRHTDMLIATLRNPTGTNNRTENSHLQVIKNIIRRHCGGSATLTPSYCNLFTNLFVYRLNLFTLLLEFTARKEIRIATKLDVVS